MDTATFPREAMEARIRILIVDDHPVVRSGLRTMLNTQLPFEVIGEAADGITAITMIENDLPDVVLLDLRMPKMSGIEVLRSLAARQIRVKAIVLTNYEMNEDIYRAVEAGARGYLLKDASMRELARAIHAVHSGRREFPRSIAASLAERMCRSNLTTREVDVLNMLVKGLTNKGIGQALQISEHTARNHVIKILEKLEASDRTEAVSIAIRRGIVRV